MNPTQEISQLLNDQSLSNSKNNFIIFLLLCTKYVQFRDTTTLTFLITVNNSLCTLFSNAIKHQVSFKKSAQITTYLFNIFLIHANHYNTNADRYNSRDLNVLLHFKQNTSNSPNITLHSLAIRSHFLGAKEQVLQVPVLRREAALLKQESIPKLPISHLTNSSFSCPVPDEVPRRIVFVYTLSGPHGHRRLRLSSTSAARTRKRGSAR